MLRRLTIIVLLVPFLSRSAHAQLIPNLGGQRVGISSLQFMKIGVEARGAGLGEAMVAIAGDVSSLYWNPAGLVLLKDDAIIVSHGEWLVGLKHDFAGIAYRLTSADVLGLSAISLQSEDMPVTTETQPLGTGMYFRYSDLAVGVTYSRKMTNQFSFGTTVRYVQENLANVKIQTFLFDLGTYYSLGIGSSRFGVVVSNFGSDVAPQGTVELLDHSTVNTFQSFSPPTVFKIGFAFEPLQDESQRLTTSVQLNHPNDNAENFRIGLEYAWQSWLFLRLGVKRTIGEPLFGAAQMSAEDYSVGAGVFAPVGISDVKFDYAFTHFNELGGVHRISMEFTY